MRQPDRMGAIPYRGIGLPMQVPLRELLIDRIPRPLKDP